MRRPKGDLDAAASWTTDCRGRRPRAASDCVTVEAPESACPRMWPGVRRAGLRRLSGAAGAALIISTNGAPRVLIRIHPAHVPRLRRRRVRTDTAARGGSLGNGARSARPRADRLRVQRRRKYGDADRDGHQYPGGADPGRPRTRIDRDHAGREDRLCRQHHPPPGPPRLGDADRDRHQHAGQADPGREQPLGIRDHAGWADRLRRRSSGAIRMAEGLPCTVTVTRS